MCICIQKSSVQDSVSNGEHIKRLKYSFALRSVLLSSPRKTDLFSENRKLNIPNDKH